MKEEFVKYEQALALKELGFDETCLKWYMHSNNLSDDVIFLQYKKDDEFCYAPLKQQVFRWFRENYDLDSIIVRSFSMTKSYHYNIIINQDYDNDLQSVSIPDKTYEEAEDACIDKLISIIKLK